ncbi:MAG: hypothetical protein ACRETN_06655 [Nevskiales bacterium]
MLKPAAYDFFRGFLVVALMLLAHSALAAPKAVAELTLNYQKSADRQMSDGGHLFARCQYLGSGDGTATGAIAGRVGWDLHEDQSRDDLHPTQFRGFIERDGKRHPFQIIGVFTPEPGQPIRRWKLTGTIVFDDNALFTGQHAPVTGYVETGSWKHRYTVLVDSDVN